LPIIINSNPSEFQGMISSPAGIDSTLLRISPCNLQAPKSQHPFYSTKSAGQMCYIWSFLTNFTSTWHIFLETKTIWCIGSNSKGLNWTQWWLSGIYPRTSKQVLGFKPVFCSLANYHQISIFLKSWLRLQREKERFFILNRLKATETCFVVRVSGLLCLLAAVLRVPRKYVANLAKIGLNPPGDARHHVCIRELKIQTLTQCAGESCADPSATELDLGVPTGCHVGPALLLRIQQNKRTKSNGAAEKQDKDRPRIIAQKIH
jgi:hypothetical protein